MFTDAQMITIVLTTLAVAGVAIMSIIPLAYFLNKE